MYALGAAIIPGVMAGASINLLDKTNIIKYLDREKQYQPNVSFLTPPLCNMFLRTRKSSYQYSRVVTAGDRITPATFENFENKFGKLINLYGSTELGAIATNKLDDPLNIRSKGILETMPGVTMDFTDKESENDPERVSEIICSHDYGFDTYVDKKGQKITSETAKPFRTKDLGKRIAANRFQVAGRTGNSVNRQGILVAFSEVESIIEQGIEEVAHAVVTGGKEDITRGKKMIAWCELKSNTKPDNQELRSRCFNIMLRHMVPDEVRIIKEIPRLPNGKFDRKKLAALG
jgi:acyl-coenzyme A synthetase/AMP-(fatty) acid ligase